MYKVTGKLTVFFEEPFWVGVFERTENGKLSVCKVTFGAEPKDYDAMDFVQKNYFSLQFSSAVKADARKEHTNPKRAQREARRQTAETVKYIRAFFFFIFLNISPIGNHL